MEEKYYDEYLLALIYLYNSSCGVKFSIEEEKLKKYRDALISELKNQYNEDLPDNIINYKYKFYFTALDANKNKVCVLNLGNSLSVAYKVLIKYKPLNYIKISRLPNVLEKLGIYEKEESIHEDKLNNIKL